MISVLAFGLATVGLAFILHSQFFSFEFVSNIFALGLAMICLAFFSTILYGDYLVVKMSLGQAVQNCKHDPLFVLLLYT